MRKDAFGDRMKTNYENPTKYVLPRRTNVIIRLDGRAFHTWTKNAQRPFDSRVHELMYLTTGLLCSEIQGVKFGYTQSDEISLLLTDYDTIDTQMWFGGVVQKMASVAASIATAKFNELDILFKLKSNKLEPHHSATFDARVFTIADPTEAINYFIWRQQDCSRNSLNLLAQSHFSHKELQGAGHSQLHEMLHSKGVNWNDCATWQKRGSAVYYEHEQGRWKIDHEIPVFTKDRSFIKNKMPEQLGEYNDND